MKIVLSVKALIFFLVVGISYTGVAQTTNYKAHAVFIFSIAKYSQWPTTANGEFVITVLGKSKLYDELVAGTSRYNINGAKIIVRETENIAQVTNSQMVVVADSKSSDLADLLKTTSGKPIMVITEREGLHKK